MRYWEDEKGYIDHSEVEPEWDVDSEEWFKVIPDESEEQEKKFSKILSKEDQKMNYKLFELLELDKTRPCGIILQVGDTAEVPDGRTLPIWLLPHHTIFFQRGRSCIYEVVTQIDSRLLAYEESKNPKTPPESILNVLLWLDRESDMKIIHIVRDTANKFYNGEDVLKDLNLSE